jgi:ferric-dicitrate binding protein FerR (iron transport regulator)
MKRLLAYVVVAISLLSAGRLANAGSEAWLVQKTSGSVTFVSGSTSGKLTKGHHVSRGTVVQTGNSGRVLLMRDKESIFIGPNTVATMARHPTPYMRTTIILKRGAATFKVRTKQRPHFSVETPYLAAVVKGTSFSVRAGSTSAGVTVKQGIVQVRALSSGQYADLSAGQSAAVNGTGQNTLTVTGRGQLPPVKKGSARAPIVTGVGPVSNEPGATPADNTGSDKAKGKKKGKDK